MICGLLLLPARDFTMTASSASISPPNTSNRRRWPWRALRVGTLAAAVLALTGCAVGVGIGFGIPLVPGLALNVGVGTGGPSIGLSTGWGPFGAGVGVDAGGRVVGSAGLGASAGPVGVGVGRSVVLHDPQAPRFERVAPDAGMPWPGPVRGTPGSIEAP